ncbi:hypothetical protein CF134_15945 [Aeromonas salmonicida]|nr:hypothetical protein CF134_15945 [Aeromonas salmonicida]
MPVQNELCGILIEDFLSIWKLRAVFLSGILVILFEGIMDLGVLEMMGADSYLSGILAFAFRGARRIRKKSYAKVFRATVAA